MYTTKKLTPPQRAWCAVIIWLFIIFPGCGKKETTEIKKTEIESAVFTRTGLLLKTTDNSRINTVEIRSEGEPELSVEVGKKGEALLDFDWRTGAKYDLDIVTETTRLNLPVYAPEKPTPVKIAEIPLENLDTNEMKYRYYASRGAEVCFSEDGKYIGVGSKGGYVYLISLDTKNIVWKHKIPEGRSTTVTFTKDGKLLAGEESRDGCLYCFDVKTGKVLWQYKTIDDFDKNATPEVVMQGNYKYYPIQLWGLSIDKDNHPYLMARYSCDKDVRGRKISVTESFVYRFDVNTGKPVWKYPIHSSTWGLCISEDGKYVIPSVGWSKSPTLSVLSAVSGKPVWEYRFSGDENGLESFRGSTGLFAKISPDNRFVVVNQVYPDYTFVFDNQASVKSGTPELLWKKKFLKVLDVSGVPISVSSVNLQLTAEDLIFATWSTRALGKMARTNQCPAQHPDADTLFVCDYQGNLKWKWKLGEGIWNDESHLSSDNRFMIIPIGLVPETPFANPHDMGVYVFSPLRKGGAKDRFIWFYHTDGFAYKAAISPDGKYIAVLEGPFDIDPEMMKENIVGKHRLIILS